MAHRAYIASAGVGLGSAIYAIMTNQLRSRLVRALLAGAGILLMVVSILRL